MKCINYVLLFLFFLQTSCFVQKKTEPYIIVDVETDENSNKYEKEFENRQDYFQERFSSFKWNQYGIYLIEDNPYALRLFFFNPSDTLRQIEILQGSQYGEINNEKKCTFIVQLDSVEFTELIDLKIDEIPKATPYINNKYPYPPNYGFSFVGYNNKPNCKKYFYFETIKQRPISKKKDGSNFYLFPYMKIPYIFDVYENVSYFIYYKILPKIPKESFNKCYSYIPKIL